MYTTDNPGGFKIQFHRFTRQSPLHPLLRTVPHPAFKVNHLAPALEGEELLLEPCEPVDGYRSAVTNDSGVPIELIQTELTDGELWSQTRSGQGFIYR